MRFFFRVRDLEWGWQIEMLGKIRGSSGGYPLKNLSNDTRLARSPQPIPRDASACNPILYPILQPFLTYAFNASTYFQPVLSAQRM